MKYNVFVTSKNKDLHALSAQEIIKNQLNQSSLKRLDRFEYFEVEFEESDHSSEKLDQILTESYYLANSNKEFYYINKLPKLPANLNYHLVSVSSKEPVDQTKKIDNVKQYFDIQLKDLKHHVLWVIGTDSTQTEDQIKSSILIASSQQQGLLVNPISHTFNFLNLTDFV